jgi:hypothetical protein
MNELQTQHFYGGYTLEQDSPIRGLVCVQAFTPAISFMCLVFNQVFLLEKEPATTPAIWRFRPNGCNNRDWTSTTLAEFTSRNDIQEEDNFPS